MTENNVEMKNDNSIKLDDKNLWKVLSNEDPETGLPLDWIEARDYLIEHGPGKALEKFFDYYEKHNDKMSSWCNYLLACHHFTEEELEGTPINRAYRRRLAIKVQKLMKKREKDPFTPMNQFLHDNKNIEV